MKYFAAFIILGTLLIVGCEKENSHVDTKYRLSALETNGDTIARFIYSNNKLMIIERPISNKKHTFYYDSKDRLEKVTTRNNLLITYTGDTKISIETEGTGFYRLIDLNENGNPVNCRTTDFGNIDHLSIYSWEDENLSKIDENFTFTYNNYPNPFYQIVNNYLWLYLYSILEEINHFSYVLMPTKNFVSIITYREGSWISTFERTYVFDEERNVVKSAIHNDGYILNFIYEIVD